VSQVLAWLAALGAAGVAIAAALRGLVRALRTGASQRRSDAVVAAQLRDNLWKEIERLTVAVDELRERAEKCEDRAADCERENRLLHEHAEAREERINQLATRVQQLEESGCPVGRCGGRP
jgi:chromosome segregation ATPase